MLIGSLILTMVHVLFALPVLETTWFAVVLIMLLGVAFALVPSALWPSVPKIIPIKQLGSAYSIISISKHRSYAYPHVHGHCHRQAHREWRA